MVSGDICLGLGYGHWDQIKECDLQRLVHVTLDLRPKKMAAGKLSSGLKCITADTNGLEV